MFFEEKSWVQIKKAGEGFCKGKTLISGKKKGAKFQFSCGDDSSYLMIKGEDNRILDVLIEEIGRPNVKWTVRSWFGSYTMYAWEKQPDRIKVLYNSICFAQLGGSIFSLLGLGPRNAELLQE